MTRRPHSEYYDAVVDLEPVKGALPRYAYVLVKRTFSLEDGQCRPLPVVPLQHDIRDDSLEPRLPLGSDFWVFKEATDVVLLGSAHAPGGRPTEQLEVRCCAGPVVKRIAIFGPRLVHWSASGQPRLGSPEPFTEIPVTVDNAYGGIDMRVPAPLPRSIPEVFSLATDPPGGYPRNFHGKGYVVLPGPTDPVELPNLEDPDDLLTAERLVVGRPEDWYNQPLPWTLDWLNPLMFPRYVYLGVDARFPAPDDGQLEEVRRGYLKPGIRGTIAPDGAPPLHHAIAAQYYQEASLGMAVSGLTPGCPVSVEGMHPGRPCIRFVLPAAPAIEFEFDRQREAAQPRLTSVLMRPAEERVDLVYLARTRGVPRPFIPGVHRHIPLSVSVDQDLPLVYQPPVPARERAREAAQESKKED